MNKSQLIHQVAASAGLTKAGAERAVNSFIDAITTQLKANKPVSIQGFGKFNTRMAAERTGKHPLTGEATFQPASIKAVFKPSQVLKDTLNQ
jgi:DNA-binding protein HU-beta